MPKYFDIHSHLNSPDFVDDLEEVIARLDETDTFTIVVGTDFESSQKAVELANMHERIYACIGVHPVDNPTRVFDKDQFLSIASNSKVVAIGECGMDFFHSKKEDDYERQKALFLAQINFALELGKPIMIHARSAYEEILEILEPLKKDIDGDLPAGRQGRLRGNVHFFAGDVDTAKRFIDIGFTLSFTGVITFTKDYDDVLRFAPLEMIMSETDAPYVAPVPYRGKRNEPSYVSEVVHRIAKVKDEDLEVVRAKLVENALRMIG